MYSRIASGELIDPLEVRTAAGLTKGDKAQLLGAIQTAKAEPDFRGAVSILNDSIPVIKEPKNATPEQHDLFVKQNARATEEYNETLSAYNQEMKDHPGQNKQEAMRKVLQPAVHKRIADMLDQRFGVTANEPDSGSWLTRAPGATWKTWLQSRMGERHPEAAPAGPKEGDTKKNSAGDPVIYRGGKWGPA